VRFFCLLKRRAEWELTYKQMMLNLQEPAYENFTSCQNDTSFNGLLDYNTGAKVFVDADVSHY
jgi:hypothetical protein